MDFCRRSLYRIPESSELLRARVEIVVYTPLADELVVVAALYYPAVFKDKDNIGILYSRKPVSYHYNCLFLCKV